MAEQVIDMAIEGIADRTAVDWDALDKEIGSEEDRAWLNCLRILGGIADLHEAVDPDVSDVHVSPPDTAPTTPRAAEADPADEASFWGRYRLMQKVGEGGFGSVYRAWDPDLEREVAIKILYRRVADSRLKEGLLREGRALARVRHAHVVSVLGVEAHGDQIALCMEFVHGETLEDALHRHGTLNAREAALVGEDVCRALAAVHLAGFVHRDVKARNVMREQAGRIVLMDFGAGQQTDDLRTPGKVSNVGTPLYMAPEVLAGSAASPISDVYSAGVLLYHLVTGEYPVEGANVEEIRAAHIQGRRHLLAERRPDLPARFIQVIDGALVADPSRRYETAAAFLEALRSMGGLEERARTIVRAIAFGLAALAAIALLGLVMTSAFNTTLGRRSPFNPDSPLILFQLGRQSLVTPGFYIGTMLLVAWAAQFSVDVLRAQALRRPRLESARRRLASLSATLRLNQPAGFAQAIAIVGLLSLVVIVWAFRDILLACTTTAILDGPVESLSALRPGHAGAFYRMALDAPLLMFILALVRLRRMRASGRRWSAGTAPIVGLLALTILLSATPYRILWKNELERLVIAGERCYLLGEYQEQAQVYCPDRDAPRTRVISLSDRSVVRTGLIENLFTPAAVSH